MKRILAIALSAVLLLGVFAVAAGAEEETTVSALEEVTVPEPVTVVTPEPVNPFDLPALKQLLQPFAAFIEIASVLTLIAGILTPFPLDITVWMIYLALKALA